MRMENGMKRFQSEKCKIPALSMLFLQARLCTTENSNAPRHPPASTTRKDTACSCTTQEGWRFTNLTCVCSRLFPKMQVSLIHCVPAWSGYDYRLLRPRTTPPRLVYVCGQIVWPPLPTHSFLSTPHSNLSLSKCNSKWLLNKHTQ